MCLFCEIINKKIPADIVYEDDEMIGFKDIRPHAKVHLLIVPKKKHIEKISDLTEDDIPIAGKMIYTAKKIAEQVGIAKDGYRLILNCGDHGGQIIFHIHCHLLGGEKLGPKLAHPH